MNGYEKQEVYAKLKGKLKRALALEFWFEACMIEYAIIEDRTSSILQHSGSCKDAYREDKLLANKLNSIEHQIGKKNALIIGKVDPKTITELKNWKERRNNLVHRSCNRPYDNEEIKQVALDGKMLVDQLSNQSQKISRASKRMEEAE